EGIARCVLPLVTVLRQLATLLDGMTDEQYRSNPSGFTSTIGGHVRPSPDHVDALLAAPSPRPLHYSTRPPPPPPPPSPPVAITRQERQLREWTQHAEGPPLRLTVLMSSALPAFEFGTTLGRELAFVLSHTIHHNALIAVMARALELAVPERFGYAPSTLAHL